MFEVTGEQFVNQKDKTGLWYDESLTECLIMKIIYDRTSLSE